MNVGAAWDSIAEAAAFESVRFTPAALAWNLSFQSDGFQNQMVGNRKLN